MPRWIISEDQGFEGTILEAKEALETFVGETARHAGLWKLVGEATADVEVTVSQVED